jgi:hypothetical protein
MVFFRTHFLFRAGVNWRNIPATVAEDCELVSV